MLLTDIILNCPDLPNLGWSNLGSVIGISLEYYLVNVELKYQFNSSDNKIHVIILTILTITLS